MIRLSANLGFLWPDRPLLERIGAAGRAGFEAVELHWPFDTEPRLVAEACAAAGVTLLAVNTPVGDASRGEFGLGAVPGREADFSALARQAVDWCAAAGGTAVHAMAGVAQEAEEARTTFVANLRRAAAMAGERGLGLLIEPINREDKPGYFLGRVEQAAAIVESVGAPNLRVMFDAYHVAREEGDVLDRLRRFMPLVGHIQVAAVPSRAEPDEGELDYRSFLGMVASSSYRGWVGCEYRPRGDTDAGLLWRDALLPLPSADTRDGLRSESAVGRGATARRRGGSRAGMSTAGTPTPPERRSNVSLRERAYRIRRNALRMGEVQGQGYIAQALDIADVLAAAYFHAMRYRPSEPRWEGRDRFLLSNGHYAIALYAALIEAGILAEDEIETYGSDGSRLPMSGMAAYTPGMEMSGGSLGLGLSIAVGMALGLKRKGSSSLVYVLFSDGELDEGSVWEAIMSAAHFKLDNLVAIVDVNNQQADGPSGEVMAFEPLAEKLQAFGWFTQRIDGNDLDAVVEAFDAAKDHPEPKPRMIVCDTLMGRGVPFLEAREKSHFIRVDEHEWRLALDALEKGRTP